MGTCANRHSRMNKSSHQRKSMRSRAALIGHTSFGEAGKRAASPEDFPGKQQALPVALEESREGWAYGESLHMCKGWVAFTLNDKCCKFVSAAGSHDFNICYISSVGCMGVRDASFSLCNWSNCKHHLNFCIEK